MQDSCALRIINNRHEHIQVQVRSRRSTRQLTLLPLDVQPTRGNMAKLNHSSLQVKFLFDPRVFLSSMMKGVYFLAICLKLALLRLVPAVSGAGPADNSEHGISLSIISSRRGSSTLSKRTGQGAVGLGDYADV